MVPAKLPRKVLDATTGFGGEFNSADNLITYRFFIDGTTNETVTAIYVEKESETNGFYLDVSCADYNGVTVRLQGKTKFPGAVFTNTGDKFTEDELKIFYYT